MPTRPQRHVPRGQVEQRAQRRREYDSARGSSAKRGYGQRWRDYVAWFFCQPENVFCACGCGKLTQCVDHIEPVEGPSDPLFWDMENHQGLTNDCHRNKTNTMDGGFGRKPVADAEQRRAKMKAAAKQRAEAVRSRGMW